MAKKMIRGLVFMCAAVASTLAQVAVADVLAGRLGGLAGENIIYRFGDAQSDNAVPLSVLGGAATGLKSSNDIVFDPVERVFYIADFSSTAIRVFAKTATGNTPPLRVITSPSMGQPRQIALLAQLNELLVITSLCCISSYPRDANGAVAATRSIGGSSTLLNNPSGLVYNPGSDEIFVGDFTAANAGEVLVFPRTANGDVAPTRSITGNLTQLGGFVSALAINPTAGELYVLAAPAAGGSWGLHTFAVAANGNVAPLRSISGANTQINSATALSFDAANDQLIVASDAYNAVDFPALLFFPRTANGNVQPTKVIRGSNTGGNEGGWYSVHAVDSNLVFSNGFE